MPYAQPTPFSVDEVQADSGMASGNAGESDLRASIASRQDRRRAAIVRSLRFIKMAAARPKLLLTRWHCSGCAGRLT